MYRDSKEIQRNVVVQLHGLGMAARWQGKGDGWIDGWMDGLGHFRMGEGSFNLNHEATVLQRDQSHNGIKAMAHCGQDTHPRAG